MGPSVESSTISATVAMCLVMGGSCLFLLSVFCARQLMRRHARSRTAQGVPIEDARSGCCTECFAGDFRALAMAEASRSAGLQNTRVRTVPLVQCTREEAGDGSVA